MNYKENYKMWIESDIVDADTKEELKSAADNEK